METLVALDLPPGISSNGTRYSNRNRWVDGSLVRFHEGSIRPVGGWTRNLDTNGTDLHVVGTPRGSLGWRDNSSTGWIAVGTTGIPSKLYALNLGVLTDITPAGLVNGFADGSVQSGGPYGAGLYGVGPYGVAGGVTFAVPADTWSLDNFGQILIACLTSDGKIYESTAPAVAAQVTNSPTGCRGVVVTGERFIFALGASGDPRNVAWCSQGNRTLWAPAVGNSAGSFPLQTQGRLVAGAATARETLLWTDADLWAASYIGGTLIYRFDQRGDNCGLIGPNAVAIADGAAYWMGDGKFFVYAGAVRTIPCPVREAVFGNLSATQRAKIQAVPVPAFSEMWWFYPSANQSGTENDRYVCVNYATGVWMVGALARAAGIGAGVFTNPQLWTSDGYLYTHESGTDKGGAVPFLESGPLEIGDGDQVLRVQTLLPDELHLGDLTATFFGSFQPEGPEATFGPYQLSARTDVRLSARQVRVRFDENNIITGVTMDSGLITMDGSTTMDAAPGGGVDWRAGRFRLGVLPGGKR